MTHGERRRIAEKVAKRYNRIRQEPDEEDDVIPLEILFDAGLSGRDKLFLLAMKVSL